MTRVYGPQLKKKKIKNGKYERKKGRKKERKKGREKEKERLSEKTNKGSEKPLNDRVLIADMIA